MNELVLAGCRPQPLAGYLKALGVLRLITEQSDKSARARWEGGNFRLTTEVDRDQLLHFFLADYCPTPILAPWNGGSGFYPKDTKTGISALEGSGLVRFASYREAIDLCARLIRERALQERPTDEAKVEFISSLRAEAGGAFLSWIDATVALTLDKMAFPPLLGTGGNDGRLDFTNNFMQRLTEVVPVDGGQPTPGMVSELDAALFGSPMAGLTNAVIGQFAPGAAGGPNSAAGFQGDSLVNRWDFILMLEGAVVFAGGVSRRLEAADAAYLSYPFTVRSAASGYGSASLEEQADSRGELWAPIWSRPASYGEVHALFREGRLSIGARPVRDGFDAARAVAALGAQRGISSFERFGFVKRQGLAYLAAPLGRHRVESNPRGDLLNELDRNNWLERLRSRAASGDATAELKSAAHALEDRIFAVLDRPDEPRVVQDVLIALGVVVRAIALRPKLQELLRPLPLLSERWVDAADDHSAELRVALALAGLQARTTTDGIVDEALPVESARPTSRRFGLPMRVHLAPLDPETSGSAPKWAQGDLEGRTLAVWGAGSLTDNLCAVARRRVLEQARHGWSDVPFHGAFDDVQRRPVAVYRGDVAAFINGDLQDRRIAELLLGLSWVRSARSAAKSRNDSLPFSYAVIKPLFTPRDTFKWLREHGRLKSEIPNLHMPSALPALLIAGRVPEAIRMAQERARASGLPTPFLGNRFAQRARERDQVSGRRLLAALIIPVDVDVAGACLDQVYPHDEIQPSAEESQHAT